MARKKKTEENIDNKVLPIPMLGKELKRFEGTTFYLASHEYGVLYHVYNSMDLIIRPSQESAYDTLVDIIENSERYNEMSKEDKENFDLYVSAVAYVLGLPLFVFTSPEFLFTTATSIINYLDETINQKQELVEPDAETIEKDESFKQATLGMEDIKEALSENKKS
jgi:hypothetical protein